jgi:hypothetical protein
LARGAIGVLQTQQGNWRIQDELAAFVPTIDFEKMGPVQNSSCRKTSAEFFLPEEKMRPARNGRHCWLLQCIMWSFRMSNTEKSEKPKAKKEQRPPVPTAPGRPADGLESPRSYHC